VKRSKFSEEHVVYALRQAEGGTPVGDPCRHLGVSDATFYAWKKKYAHLGVSELRRLRQLEEENSRFKRMVADLSLDKHMLSEALRRIGTTTDHGGSWDGMPIKSARRLGLSAERATRLHSTRQTRGECLY